MNSEWREVEVGDFCEILSSKRIFAKDYVEDGIPFYRSKEIIQKAHGQFSGDELFITEKRFFDIKNKFGAPTKGDLLISAVGNRSGIPYCIREEYDFYFKDGNLIWFRNFSNELSSEFLEYYLGSRVGQIQIDSMMIGSAQKALTISGVKKLKINLPPLPTQKAIAKILGDLDAKIALNRKMNESLEAMAQALFQSWFVDFDIEKKYNYVELGSVIKTTSGGTPSRKKMEYYDSGIYNWVKSKELNSTFIIDTEEKITEEALNKSSAKLIPENSVLIAMYGATVGEFGLISKEMTCNQAICALIPCEKYPYPFLLMFAKSKKDELINLAVGSAQQNISQIIIKKLLVPDCIDKTIEFSRITEPYFKKIEQNLKQTQSLTKLRNTLLPQLLSGKLSVPDAMLEVDNQINN